MDDAHDRSDALETAPGRADGSEPARPGRAAGLASWAASGAVHATILALMCSIYFIGREPEVESRPMVVPPAPVPDRVVRERPEPRPPTDQPEAAVIAPDDRTEQPSVAGGISIELPSEIVDVPPEEVSVRAPSEPSLSFEPSMVSAVIGGGSGGGGGGIGRRSGPDCKRAVLEGGGTHRSELAVASALRWFTRHQSPNGMWDAEGYARNCTEAGRCEPGSTEGLPAEQVNVALTAYALLAYLGHGYDHRAPSSYRQPVRKGLEWLLSVQRPDGLLGSRNYEHPVAAMALAEAYAMTSDPALRAPAQRAVDVIIGRQNRDSAAGMGASGGGGLGWDYAAPGTRNDASVTGWNLMALKSAHIAGLNTGDALAGGRRWLEAAWRANNDGRDGRTDWRTLDPYRGESVFSYTWPTGAGGYDKAGFGHQDMAPVALVCGVFLGHGAGDPMTESLANWVAAHQRPAAYPANTYYLYYNSLGLFQMGGERWKAWNAPVRDLLVGAQRSDAGCMNGSWDWEGTGFHGHRIGRVLSTAYCALSLEVYYRYDQLGARKGVVGNVRKGL